MSAGEDDRFCLSCKYSLRGLTENRCPECGRSFNPDDPSSYWNGLPSSIAARIRNALSASATPWLAIPVLWGATFLPFISGLATLFGCSAFVTNLILRRWAHATVIVLASPFAAATGYAAFDYLNGSGELRATGLPGVTFFNVDPAYRCTWRSGGCLVTGNEWIIDAPYNACLKLFIRTLGPMHGSYLGPYPTETECTKAVANAEPVPVESFKADCIKLSTTTVKLDKGVGLGLIENTIYDPLANVSEQIPFMFGPIRASMVKDCLVLQIPAGGYPIGVDSGLLIVVIDPASGRPFAYYTVGRVMGRFSPEQWRSDR